MTRKLLILVINLLPLIVLALALYLTEGRPFTWRKP